MEGALMPQPTDIVLDGAGYMIVPGKYTRGQDGAAEGRTGRIAFTDFFGGSRRHIQLERDRAFDTLRAGPALNGQGVRPWGRIAAVTTLVPAVLPSEDTRIPYAAVEDVLYFALGTRVYKTAASGDAYFTPTVAFDTGTTIVDMCPYSSNGLLITFGDARDVTWYRVSDGAATVLLAGERGHQIAGYGGYAIWNDATAAGRPTFLKQVTGTQVDLRILDYDVTRIVSAGAKCYAVTKSAIYSYTGRVTTIKRANPAYSGTAGTEPTTIDSMEWTNDWTPYFQHGVTAEPDDFKLFEGFGGRIYAWVAGEVMEDNPNGDRAGWRSTGLSGKRCYGGCVAGGYVVVSIESWDDMNQLWGWDGSGWWKLDEKASAETGNWIWPTPANNSGSWDLMVFRHGSDDYDLYRLQDRTATTHAFPSGGSHVVTPMIDAGERDKAKAWRKVGAVFATPERTGNLASVDTVALYLDYSTDGGETWTVAASASCLGNTMAYNNLTLDGVLSAQESRFLMLRVRWVSVSDWVPILVGLWCEFEVLDSPARRRKWAFAVKAEDQVIDRDGRPIARTGRELIAALWAAWQGGTTLPFQDLDYDADAAIRTVRIVGISESVPKSSDQGRWGDSVVNLQLVEV
jgi:hypothetical protein